MRSKSSIFIFIYFFFAFSSTYSQNLVERVEPPNWWIGMTIPEVQLMLYGEDISTYDVRITSPGVRLIQSIHVENSNYLFLDLNISPIAQPGKVPIILAKDDNTITYEYALMSRDKESAQRMGFDASDVLYLITPDRFANANPENDSMTGLMEGPDRSKLGGRHGGDVQGIIDHLDYIKEMGFTAVWLNPILENNQPEYSYHGYSTTDFYKVDPRYGSNDLYQQMGKMAHQKGLKVIMDMIVNHCGSGHWWMEDLPTSDWLNRQDMGYVETSHRKSVTQDPYRSQSDYYRFINGWFVPTMPDLNQLNPLMATYLIQNSIWWVEYAGLDGIRMDTYPYPDHDFMADWTCAMADEYPHFTIVGEEWYENPAIVSYWQEGKINPNGYTSCLESLMDFSVQATMVRALNAEESWSSGLINLYEMIANDFLYPDPYNLVTFPDNHDMSRFYTQVNEDIDLFKNGLVFTLTSRGIPQLYYGTEILMTNPGSNDHGLIRSDYPGGWDGDTINAFTSTGLTKSQIEARDYIKKILAWRKNNTAAHYGKLTHYSPQEKTYVYFRESEKHKFMVVINKNKEEYKLPLSRFEENISPQEKGINIISGLEISLQEDIMLSPMEPMIIEMVK